MSESAADPREQSLPQLVKQLGQESSTLVRQEVELAKAEVLTKVSEIQSVAREAGSMARRDLEMAKQETLPKVKRLGVGAGEFAAAGVVGLIAVLFLLAGATAGLALLLPVWAAALIVGGVLALIAAVVAAGGAASIRSAMPMTPERTIATARRDVELMGSRVRGAVPPKPEQTVETVEEDVEWLRGRVRHGA